jgi:2,3-bisphosphoglycerate-independent phosphoglycerate mutase
VLVLPEAFANDEDPSPLRQRLTSLNRLAEQGAVGRLSPLPRVETPEALYLGLDPSQGQMRQGPLTISALGADPPERSTHFHLSLMAFHEGVASRISTRIPDDEWRKVVELGKRLNTRLLTLVAGEQCDHGLVWEALGDLGTTSASEVDGKSIQPALPAGDGERILRRFIDDSVNLLSEQEFNQRREDADLAPLNLLWPWGHGVRLPAPNLALRRGEPALVMSGSLRLAGLTRLVGYRHTERPLMGNGLNAQFENLVERARSWQGPVLMVLDAIPALRAGGKMEELHWLIREIDDRLITPLCETADGDRLQLSVLATGDVGGLSLTWDSTRLGAGRFPFDERTLDETHAPTAQLWEAAAEALGG